MTKPISPKDVVSAKTKAMPDEVLEAFNELIAANWNGTESVVLQRDAVALIREKLKANPSDESKEIQTKWLDVEPIYQREGWIVTYDKPGYNESYPASYTFKKRRTRG